jgi:hypothetical protein
VDDRNAARRIICVHDFNRLAVIEQKESGVARLAAAICVEQRLIESNTVLRYGNDLAFRFGKIGVGFE